MSEQNSKEHSTEQRNDAIDINDFVFAATGARVRRVTAPDGEHWFVAADVASDLGYANPRQALIWHVAPECTKRLSEFAQGVYTLDVSRKLAAHRLQKSMKMVNLRGLVALVNGSTKPECLPFKTWVSEVIETIHKEGTYSLEPSPAQTPTTGAPAYVMPKAVADAIVRLEVRNIQADEMMAAFQEEQTVLLRQISRSQNTIADALQDIARTLRSPGSEPQLTPQQLLAAWRAKNLVFTEDVHAVAAYLAPALVRGEAGYRLEEIATRAGLTSARVHDSLRLLLKRGCIRQTGCTADGAPTYVLP
ncbi:Bro-N domain-containing protein [Streptomyces sp. NPDC005374]|uniref:BRO-N domain-containing protein n=1 Tax=Streptomyces sp. NPDC005374 TaxID=3364713 RepID=UPI0036CF6141